GPNCLFKNNGDGTFTNVAEAAGVADDQLGHDAAWVDYDRDGFVDLFTTNYQGLPNILYRNNGDGTFSDVTDEAGLIDYTWTSAALWGDYNKDGYPDLYLANAHSEANILYRNNGDGTFTDVTGSAGVGNTGWSRSAAWGDYDNDMDLDLYVVNGWADTRNVLYRNNGDGTFTDLTDQAGVSDLGDGYGAMWVDYNNDGYLDLYVSNFYGPNKLFHNNGDGTFTEVGMSEGVAFEGNTDGFAWGDYNGDGFMDLYIATINETNILYKNLGNDNHWLEVKLSPSISNASAIGTRLELYSGALAELRYVEGGMGRFSQNSLIVHFGLGEKTHIDSLIVYWPSGMITTVYDLGVDSIITVAEGPTGIEHRRIKSPLRPDISVFPNPIHVNSALIRLVLPVAEEGRLSIFDVSGRRVRELKEGTFRAGSHSFNWNGKDDLGNTVPSGVYFADFKGEKLHLIGKFSLIR
ncbi:MAG: VCBS repeat-containing protein, partial [Candidatus Hydrothermae bacterium]|nr:VCBS repeat-containing protein [Candidatus Hydrothermae bacterium]